MDLERRRRVSPRELAVERSRRAGLPMDQPLVEFGSPPDLMAAVLDGLRERHGGAAGYLHDHGLTAAELDRLRARLTA